MVYLWERRELSAQKKAVSASRMQKERITKDDGRYLIYYSFDDEDEAGEAGADETGAAQAPDGSAGARGAADAAGEAGSSCCSGKAKAAGERKGQGRKGCGSCQN
ncbi:MAG: hypothetical protein ACOX3I_10575 [Limnochordia bacterium]